MDEKSSRAYFQRRAGQERLAASIAIDCRAAQSHRDLAEKYEKLAAGTQDLPSHEREASEGILPKEFRILP